MAEPRPTALSPSEAAARSQAWVEAAWAALRAKHEFSMLPHALPPERLATLPATPEPIETRPGPRIVFFGMGSDYGLTFLLGLLRAGLPVVAVVTSARQERHRVPHDAFTLVEAHTGIPRHAARSVNRPAARELIAGYRPDLIVIASFDQILRREALAIPRLGVVNAHPSLLPAYRGPEPLFWQILHAEPQAGITIHQVNELIDAGPPLAQAAFPLAPDETAGTLARKAAFAGVPILIEAVERLWRGEPPPAIDTPWRESYHGAVESRPVNWAEPAGAIARLVRAGSPDRLPWASAGGRRLSLARAEAIPGAAGASPGAIVGRGDGWLDVATGAGCLRILELRPALPDSPDARGAVPLTTVGEERLGPHPDPLSAREGEDRGERAARPPRSPRPT